jgi:transglutaminase-like putative cysteine protease
VDRPLRPDALHHLSAGAQSADSGILTIQRAWPTGDAAPPDGYLTPLGGLREPTGRIRLAADTAFAGAVTARDSVVRLTRWVTRRVAVDTNLTDHLSPDAALRRGSGPPHVVAAVLVSLARTGGMAARVVSGLALMGEELLSHVWAEVWVGGRWVPVDPAFGHAPASARLLRITEGGQGRPFETLWRTAALRVVPLTLDSR